MSDDRKWFDGLKVLTAAGVLIAGVAACDGELLDVNDPDNVQPEAQLTPENVSPRVAGMINEFREAYDLYVLYSGLITDEFILAGTFPTRREVDQRNPISQNTSIDADVWEPLSVTRAVADQNLDEFAAAMGTDEFSGQTGNLQTGIAWGNLIAGYSRLFMAELFCHSILGGGSAEDLPRFVENETIEDAPLGTEARAEEALTFFQEAEATGQEFGSQEVELAALVGQARTHMLLYSLTGEQQHLEDAEAAASTVWITDPMFTSAVEYSISSAAEENGVFQFSWGVNASLRWTVGEGSDDSRGNERFAYYGDVPLNEDGSPDYDNSTGWVGQGLIIPPVVAEAAAPAGPGLAAFNNVSPVAAQTLYAGRAGGQRDVSIALASAWEARMIMAEYELRADGNNNPAAAEDMANDLLDDADQVSNPMTSVNAGLTATPGSGAFTTASLGAFEEISLDAGSEAANLANLAEAYEAGLWLTSHRHHYLRRMAEEFGDRFFPRNAAPGHFGSESDVSHASGSLWPDHGEDGGDAITLPLPVSEVDGNQNVSSACPAGYP